MTEGTEVATTCTFKTKRYMSPDGAETYDADDFKSYDISDMVQSVNCVSGRNVVFSAVDVYISKYLWQSPNIWANASEDGTLGVVVPGESELYLNCYAVSNGKYIITQSNTTSEYVVLRCYPFAYKLKTMSVQSILPSIRFKEADMWTLRSISKNSMAYTLNFQDIDLQYSRVTNGVEEWVDGKGTLIPKTPGNNSAYWSNSTKDRTDFGGQDCSIILHVIGGNNIKAGYRVYFRQGPDTQVDSIGFKNSYYSSQTYDAETGYVTVTLNNNPGLVCAKTVEDLLYFLAVCTPGYDMDSVHVDTGFAYLPSNDNTFGYYSTNAWLDYNKKYITSLNEIHVDTIQDDPCPRMSISQSWANTIIENLYNKTYQTHSKPIGAYKVHLPAIGILTSANMHDAICALCKLANLSPYYDDKIRMVSRIPKDYIQNYHFETLSSGTTYAIKIDGTDTGLKSDEFKYVTELKTTYESGSSWYKLDGSEDIYPLNWISESKNVDTGAQSIVQTQYVKIGGLVGHSWIVDCEDKNRAEDLDYSSVFYAYSSLYDVMNAPLSYVAGKDQSKGYNTVGLSSLPAFVIDTIGINEVINNCVVSPSFKFDLQEFSQVEDTATYIEATFHPEITSASGLPTASAEYDGKYIAIRCADESKTNDYLFVCQLDSKYRWVNPTWSDEIVENKLYCRITNYPHVSLYKYKEDDNKELNWKDHTDDEIRYATRIATFPSDALFGTATDEQNNISGSKLLMSYIETTWPVCKTTYCIGNNALTDSEALLNNMSSSISDSSSIDISNVTTATTSNTTVYGNMSTSEYISAITNSKYSAFSGLVLRSSQTDGMMSGYESGVEQIRISASGKIEAGSVYKVEEDGTQTDERVGASVVLDSDGLTTYKYAKVPVKIDVDGETVEIDSYQYAEQCCINTDGEIIAGARLYKMDADGFSYNFGSYDSPNWGSLLAYDEVSGETVLNGDIKVSTASMGGLKITDKNNNLVIYGGLKERKIGDLTFPDDVFQVYNPSASLDTSITRYNAYGQMISGTDASGWTLLDGNGLKIYSYGSDPTAIGSDRKPMIMVNSEGFYINTGKGYAPAGGTDITIGGDDAPSSDLKLLKNASLRAGPVTYGTGSDATTKYTIRLGQWTEDDTEFNGLYTYDVDDSGNLVQQCSVNTDGQITAGGGNVILDSEGLTVLYSTADTTYKEQNALKFKSEDGTRVPLRLYHITDPSTKQSVSVIDAPSFTSKEETNNTFRLNVGEGGSTVTVVNNDMTRGSFNLLIGLFTPTGTKTEHSVKGEDFTIDESTIEHRYNNNISLCGYSAQSKSKPLTPSPLYTFRDGLFSLGTLSNPGTVYDVNNSGKWSSYRVSGNYCGISLFDSSKTSEYYFKLSADIENAYVSEYSVTFTSIMSVKGINQTITHSTYYNIEMYLMGDAGRLELFSEEIVIPDSDKNITISATIPQNVAPIKCSKVYAEVHCIWDIPGECLLEMAQFAISNFTYKTVPSYTFDAVLYGGESQSKPFKYESNQSLTVTVKDSGDCDMIGVGTNNSSYSASDFIGTVICTPNKTEMENLLPVKLYELTGENYVLVYYTDVDYNGNIADSISYPTINVRGTSTSGSGGKIEISKSGQDLYGNTDIQGNLTVKSGNIFFDGYETEVNGESLMLSDFTIKTNVNVIGGQFVLQPSSVELSDTAVEAIYQAIKKKHDSW